MMFVLAQAWGLLPLAVFAGLVRSGRKTGASWTDAFLGAMPLWAAFAWGMSNVLGIWGAMTTMGLRAGWGTAVLAVFALDRWSTVAWFRSDVTSISMLRDRKVDWLESLLFAGSGLLVALALLTAVFAAPSTVDVLNYHLPRQVMWLQQGSLDHFLTVNDRQLMMPPLAEVIGLQFLALTGDDRWVNLPQWFCYAGLIIAVVSTLRVLEAGRRAVAAGAWLTACLPMTYVEASGAKNDLMGAMWIALLLREVAQAGKAFGPPRLITAIRSGLIVGLALLTKSTAFLYTPVLVVCGLLTWARRGRTPFVRASIAAVLACLLMVAPFFIRNIAWYGSPLGVHRIEDGGQQQNAAITPAIVASNLLRGGAQQLAMPWEGWNSLLDRGVRAVHRGLGISPDDPRSTCWGASFEIIYAPDLETHASAPVHFLLIIAGVSLVCVMGFARECRWLAWSCIAMAVFYVIVLKWQPWALRLQQPVFVVGVVLIAAMSRRLASSMQAPVLGGISVLSFIVWWPSREVTARPLWSAPSVLCTGREAMLYRYLPLLRQRDETMLDILKEAGARNILVWSVHDIPYPLMKRVAAELPGAHFYGAPAGDAAIKPDAILQLGVLRPAALYYVFEDGSRFRLTGDVFADGVYLPETMVAERGWTRRLPAFAGWSKQEGFRLRDASPDSSGHPAVWRELGANGAVIDFDARTSTMTLTATVAQAPGIPVFLVIFNNGIEMGRVELVPGAPVQAFDIRLRCEPGANRLEIRGGAERAPLKFTRLQINDL